MEFFAWILFAAGLGLLIAGAEFLVRGSSRLAVAAGVSPLVIGLTLVAYGTSTPELAVSVKAALAGQADISLGNVVGSNIFNVLFILGVSALMTPLVVSRRLLWMDVPIMVAASGLLWWMAADGRISRTEGTVLLAGIVVYTWFIVTQAKREKPLSASALPHSPINSGKLWVHVLLCLVGLALLVWGTQWFVDGAVRIAKGLGLSELVIGLTIVAAGTSMPEVFTSLVAALRGERDIAVGNVVGSNIYNILAIQGLSSVVDASGVPVASAAINFDIPIMVAVAVACLPIFFTGHRIARWEGGLFLFYYVAYTIYIVLLTRSHDALPAYSLILWEFVVPSTLATIGVILFREWRALRQRRTA